MMSLISNQHFAAILRINLAKLSMSNQSKEFYIFSPSPLSIILYFAKRVMAENQKCSQACIILPFKQSTHGFKQAPGFSAWENGRIFFHTDQFYISKDLERRENVYAHTTSFYYCLVTQIAIATVINISYPFLTQYQHPSSQSLISHTKYHMGVLAQVLTENQIRLVYKCIILYVSQGAGVEDQGRSDG